MTRKLMLGYSQVVIMIEELDQKGKSEDEIFKILTKNHEIPKRIDLPNLICEIVNGGDICNEEE